MGLFRDLLPASYKGVSFYVTSESVSKGVIRQENITPILQENRNITEIALLPFEVTLDIVFTGNLAKHKARKFLNLASEKTSGTLQAPVFGVFKKMQFKDPFALKTQHTEIGTIKVSVTFIEVVDLVEFQNAFAFVSDALKLLDDLSYKVFDSLYVISNLTTTINTFKATVNNLLDLVDIPLLLAQDLQNALQLKQFLKDTQEAFLSKSKQVQEFILESFTLTNRNSANQVEEKKLNDINFLENFILLALTTSYMNSLLDYNFITQDEIDKSMNLITQKKQDMLSIDILPQDLFEQFNSTQNLFSIYLEEQKDDKPIIFEYEAKEESILTLNYKTLGNIEYLDQLDAINSIDDLFMFSGTVKCLKF